MKTQIQLNFSPESIAAMKKQLADASRAELGRMLAGTNMTMAVAFLHKGLILCELERRSVDTEKLGYLPETRKILLRIGSGTLLPELYEVFPDDFNLLDGFSRFALEDQRKLVDGPLPVAVRGADGGWNTEMKRVEKLDRNEKAQVLDRESIRSEEEQRAWILGREQARKATVTTHAQFVGRGTRTASSLARTETIVEPKNPEIVVPVKPFQLTEYAAMAGRRGLSLEEFCATSLAEYLIDE